MADGEIAVPAQSHDSNTFEIIIIFILIIVLLIVITLSVYYLRRSSQCYTYPSPWCYSDWICEHIENPKDRNRWDVLKRLKLSSVPQAEGACFLKDSDTSSPCENVWDFLNTTGTCRSISGGDVSCLPTYKAQNNLSS
jgi:hypothetical protein